MGQADFDVHAVARNYRSLVGVFGLQLVLGLFSRLNVANSLVLIAIIATSIGLAYYAYRTAEALGGKSPALWAIAMFVPCINILSLLALSAESTRVCRAHGIKVGLLGPEMR